MVTRLGRCAVNIAPGEGSAPDADAPPALLGAADPGKDSASAREATDARPPAGVSAETSPGLALTPNAANGSRRFVALAGGADAGDASEIAKDADAPRFETSSAPWFETSSAPWFETSSAAGFEASSGGFSAAARGDGAGPGGGHAATVATAGGLGGTPAAPVARADDAAFEEGSGKAFMAAFSSFWNSRTDSSAVSTAKETRRFARDCLRFFRAAAVETGDAPSILLTSARMERRRRLRI
jgi:hypothetical protein